jgi:hypothetical protein
MIAFFFHAHAHASWPALVLVLATLFIVSMLTRKEGK